MMVRNVVIPAGPGVRQAERLRQQLREVALPRRWQPTAGRVLPLALLLCGIGIMFRGWLASGAITWADWRYQPGARLQDYWLIPTLWDGAGANGLGNLNIVGGPTLPLLSLEALLDHLGIDPTVSMRLVWVFPGVLVAAFATYMLTIAFFSSRIAGIISGLFVVSNTYAAIVVTGGQFTVSTGYFLMAPVLLFFYRALRRPVLSRFVLTAVCLAIQVMYDARSTYITMGVLLVLALCYVLAQRSLGRALRVILWGVGMQLAVMGVVTLLVHSFWLLPARFAQAQGGGGGISLPGGYNGIFWVHVLSYMQLTHAFALFHPFWYQDSVSPRPTAVDPLFFLLPLLAFAVFLRKRLTHKEVFLFATAALAILFVKGSNPPAGGIYEWMFLHFPGFSAYRDPSKFYQPLALVYALLLGRAAAPGPWPGQTAPRRLGVVGRGAVVALCLEVILVQGVPLAANTTWGTLAPQVVPAEFVAVNRYIDRQAQFFRIIWYPTTSFGSFSALHPSMDLGGIGALLGNRLPRPSDATSWIHLPRPQVEAVLRALSVKYIIVADDPANTPVGYKTNKLQALRVIRNAFPYLPERRFGGIYVFVNPSYVPKIFIPSRPVPSSTVASLLKPVKGPPQTGIKDVGAIGAYASACGRCVGVQSDTLTREEIVVHNATRPFLLVYNQSFDANWAAYVEPTSAPEPFWWTWTHPAVAQRDHLRVNGFANAWWIDAPGTHRIVIEYWPQRLTAVGWIISWLTILGCLMIAAAPSAIRRLRRRADSVAVGRQAVPGHGDGSLMQHPAR